MNQPTTQPTPPSSGGTLKWLITVLVIIILLGGGYFLYQKFVGTSTETAETAVTATPTKSASAKASATPTTSASVPADWKTYTNTNYGFSLSFNSKWSGYTYQELTAGSSATKRINFYVPTNDNSYPTQVPGKWSPFGIVVYTIAQYNTVKNDLGPEDYLGQNSKYAFTVGYSHDSPNDVLAVAEDMKNVIATFKASQL